MGKPVLLYLREQKASSGCCFVLSLVVISSLDRAPQGMWLWSLQPGQFGQ